MKVWRNEAENDNQHEIVWRYDKHYKQGIHDTDSTKVAWKETGNKIFLFCQKILI